MWTWRYYLLFLVKLLKASTATLSLGPYCDRANFVVMLVIKVTIPSFPNIIDVTVFRERALTTLNSKGQKVKKRPNLLTLFLQQQQQNHNKKPNQTIAILQLQNRLFSSCRPPLKSPTTTIYLNNNVIMSCTLM